ncbi:hypothetical protein ONZ43_g5513 [Nemania bipapillata]|uniref:Uncharacterized protein n=1 Tax=Nemania bipapillata TaxID=110536 RepID=A0ACC2I9U4_9PEZI|nr:hypothetical protein ONZ43_g5513 [Nemania bipapillata]
MVQYIHTPWRDQAELLQVRQQFYPYLHANQQQAVADDARGDESETENENQNQNGNQNENENADGGPQHAALTSAINAEKSQQQAVSRVSMWMQRGGCPHLIESTALLTAAVLSDLHESRTKANSTSYALRAAYSTAFSRFVTGLLDGQQDKLRKMSMYSIAKNIGLPATFVELRHQATHEQLPSLSKLRSAANNALAWIWHFYWEDIIPLNQRSSGEGHEADPRKDLLVSYLRQRDEAPSTSLQNQLKSWDEPSLLQALEEIAESSEERQVILRALRLSRTMLGDGLGQPLMATPVAVRTPRGEYLETLRVKLQMLNEELGDPRVELVNQPAETPEEASNQSIGWARYQAPWKPKPIGAV